ncbi:MAG: Sip1-related alpha-galactosidase, partial [Bacteroidota bacterium]
MKSFPIALLALISLFYACSTPDTLRLEERATGVTVIYENSDRLTGLQTRGPAYAKAIPPPLKVDIIDDFVAVTLTAKGAPIQGPDEFYGTFFDSIPAFRRGVSLWRYKPWNAWTRPLLIDNPRDLKDWDVQFFYWQYEDGVYGAAIPLSGNGYRTTLGQHEGKFGAKSQSYAPPAANQDTIPQMLIGFGADPYALFKDLFETGLEVVGKPETKIATKSFPAQMDYLGWCTWNASDNG